MKPAGGIKNAKQALHYLVAVKETLGDAWLNSSRYRFARGSLLNDLLRQIAKERTERTRRRTTSRKQRRATVANQKQKRALS